MTRLARRAAPWLVPVLVLGAIGWASVRTSLPPGERDALDRLLPMVPGSTWVYRTTENGEPSGRTFRQILGTGLGSDGEKAALQYDRFEELFGGPAETIEYIGRRGDALVSLGVRDIGSGEFTSYEPPWPQYELPLLPGHVIRYRGMRGSDPITATTTFQGTVRTSALGRSFEACARFTTTFHREPQGGTPFTIIGEEVECPGVGPVRFSSTIDIETPPILVEQELVEVHVPGVNVSAPDGLDPLPAGVGLPSGGTAGFDAGRSASIPDGRLDPSRLAWSDVRLSGIQFPPVGGEGVSLLAEEDGNVSLTDVRTGAVRWRIRVQEPVVASPTLAGGVALVADAGKRLWAFDVQTGLARWVLAYRYLVATTPLVAGGTAIVVGEDRVLHAVSIADGAERWRARLHDEVRAPPILAGGLVVVGDQAGGLTALSVSTGREAWSASLDGSLAAGPVAAGDLVVAADDTNAVHGFDATTGERRWDAYPESEVTDPAIAGGLVVVVASDVNRLVALSADDGDVVWRAPLPERVEVRPAIVGDEAVVLTYDPPRLLRFSLTDGVRRGSTDLRGPDDRTLVTGRFPPSFVDGNLLVTLKVEPPWPITLELAFTTTDPGSARLRGVRFRGELRPYPAVSSVSGPLAVAGDRLLVPTRDGTVWSVPPAGAAAAVSTGDQLAPFAVPAGDLVLVQMGRELRAIPATGGSPRWTFPLSDPIQGTAPAVTGDTVVVPIRGVALAGVAPADGAPRWVQEFPGGLGTSTPLVLPGGDVAYVSGSLTRLDAATGTVRWTVGGVETLSPIAFADGTVLVSQFTGRSPHLVAYDARDGAVRWRAPLGSALLAGPAAGQGVTVAFDGETSARAFDLESGTPMWIYPLRTSALASPVILGDRVLIAERGRQEDAEERDARIVVLDLATGRYLGSYEAGGGSFAGLGSVASVDGAVLVPTVSSVGGGAIAVLRPEER